MRRAAPRLIACVALAVGIAACGDDDDDNAATSPTQPATTETPPADESPSGEETTAAEPEDDPSEQQQGETEPALTPEERAVTRAVRDYVSALADRDGEAVCALVLPGAIDEVEMPRDRGRCAASLEASIGYRDPRGLPVWKTARVAEFASVEVDGEFAKVVVTTVTQFADRDEPSIEDDVVYLVRPGGDWLIAKPSSTLYRAVGVADVPPSVLSPP